MIKNLMTKMKKKKGFTLIELIIVISIIAIIAAFAVPNFVKVQNNAKIDSDINLGRTIARTVEVLTTDGTITKNATSGAYDPITLAVTLDGSAPTNTGSAQKIQENMSDNSLTLKTPGAGNSLTITIDANGKVTTIVDSDSSSSVLYSTVSATPISHLFVK